MDDVETHPQRRPPIVVTSVKIEVVDGADKGASAVGTDLVMSVGTAKDNALVLGDITVSRFHLEVTARRGGILVTDLDSTNGTYCGVVRIDRAIVPPGTLVRAGTTTLRVDEASRSTMPAIGSGMYAGMIARTPQMMKLFGDIERVAPTGASILIVGESGTGKERVAEAIHAGSRRSSAPLVTIDCGALPSNLVASELFGHEKGAFTGADRTHIGSFERAGEGTVFLDEIGELPLADQTALLGVLERKRFRRVGGTADIELGARVLAATNRDLRLEVNHGRFRHDLYHRLAVVVLRLPPLRERPDDIPLLVAHFAHELGASGELDELFGAEMLARWKRNPWSGNIRELRNAVEAALIVGHAGESVEFFSESAEVPAYKEARAAQLLAFEHAYLTRLLEAAEGNVSQASRLAKMDRSHLIDLLQRHRLK